jgi:hypothetical protein
MKNTKKSKKPSKSHRVLKVKVKSAVQAGAMRLQHAHTRA